MEKSVQSSTGFLSVWKQQRQHSFVLHGKVKTACSFLGENHYWIAVWEITKSLLCWCAVPWLIWIDYQLILDMSFTKTLILWQRLNSSPVLLRYRVCSTQSSGWFSQLTPTDLFALTFILLSVSPLVALPLIHKRPFSIMYLLSTSAVEMNQCFHFSIITTMTIHTGALTVHTGCKCDFLIAQVCKHKVFFFGGKENVLSFYMLQNMCRQVV